MDERIRCTEPSGQMPPPELLRPLQTEKAAAWCALLFGFLAAKAGILFLRPLASAPLLLALFLLSGVFLRCCGIRLRSLWAPCIAAVLCATMVLGTGWGLHWGEGVCCVGLWCYWIYACCGASERVPGQDFPLHVWKAVLLMPISAVASLFPALFRKTGTGKRGGLRTLGLILGGILLATVPTAVIISLLRYDPRFARLTEQLFTVDPELAFRNVTSFFFGIPIAMYCFAVLASNRRGNLSGKLDAAHCAVIRERIRVLPPLTAAVMSVPILAVYGIFFFTQIQFYFSAFFGVLPDGHIVSEYARSGFFELCAVAAVNAALLLGISLFLRRREDGRSPLCRVLSVLFAVVTLLLIAIALSKMALYIRSFGLTRLRVYATWLMILMAGMFLAVLVRQFFRKGNLVLVFLVLFAVLFSGLCLSNPDGWIARYNTEIYLSGQTSIIDVDELEEIGSSAVPSLLRLAEEGKTGAVRLQAKRALQDLADWSVTDEFGFFGNTAPDFRAMRLLREAGYEGRDLRFPDDMG